LILGAGRVSCQNFHGFSEFLKTRSGMLTENGPRPCATVLRAGVHLIRPCATVLRAGIRLVKPRATALRAEIYFPKTNECLSPPSLNLMRQECEIDHSTFLIRFVFLVLFCYSV